MSNQRCTCGRIVYSESDTPGSPLYRFHRDDHSPACDKCRTTTEVGPLDEYRGQ